VNIPSGKNQHSRMTAEGSSEHFGSLNCGDCEALVLIRGEVGLNLTSKATK